jgi:ABC-type transport system involved in multi-copper enzyme maturation permease subunit
MSISLAESCVSWVRHTFAWSNSRQSWIERCGVLGLVAAVGALWWLSPRLDAAGQLSLWALLVVGAAILSRRGWLKLFGPVLFYDMIRAARRGRYILLRVMYAGFLLFILFCVWLDLGWRGGDHRQASILALKFFEAFMLVQLIAVSILTPAFVAGAISEEKDRKTMEFLLATDLRNREIVLSKLGARVANLTLFILTGLPILGLIQFLGGVDPVLVLTGFAATGMTMLGLAGLSILNSVLFKRPRDAIAITYLYLISYIALGTAAFILQKTGGFRYIDFPLWFGDGAPTLSNLVNWLNTGNILIAIINIGMAGSSAAPALLEEYALFHGILALVSVVWAIIRLRPVALRQAFASVPKAGARHRARPAVGELPMLWKEICVEGGVRLNWVVAILLAILFLLTLAPGAFIVIMHYLVWNRGGDHWFVQEINMWVRLAGTFVACLTILSVAVRASTSIGNERDKQTLDSLLTSPMDSDTMLWAKFIGTLLGVRLAWIWLGLIWTIGIVTGGLHVFALPLVLAGWLVYASSFTMLGLWFSMTCKTTMRATVYTMMTTVSVAVGHWLLWMCCTPLLYVGGHGGAEHIAVVLVRFQGGMTPPAVLFIFAFNAQDFASDYVAEMMLYCILGLAIWGVACFVFWVGLLSPRFRVYTGREQERLPEKDHDPRADGDDRRRPRRGPPPLARDYT